jgi:serine phosphatase RsbU (regulator of sigma subunit)
MSLYIDASYESLNKFNEELCGDKVEIIRNRDSVIVVLADGLGSGVKANILATLTSKIIGTMLTEGASVDEAVETIVNTLPVCRERGIAYSTFSILQVFYSGKAYLAEFDNPSMIRLKKGVFVDVERENRAINGKRILESRFSVSPGDLFVMMSDGVIHAGIGSTLNMGWQWENVRDYIAKTYRPDMSARNMSKLLISACDNLYSRMPGDDATAVAIKIR